ncbi:MAG: outer membrane beta-barrel protein, partial [Prolixibacteraceae bacterium]|nr:outer membrane beta-barrel protein [Prolixibacteraceae bacterium]
NTPSDVPGYFATALGYKISPTLRASVEFHSFNDKNARMASVIDETNSTATKIVSENKQKFLDHNTREYLIGCEYDITKHVTISGSYQYTDYGLSDNFQQQTSFSCNSYSIGFGTRIKMSEKLNLNIGYMISNYKDYTKNQTNYASPSIPFSGTDIYSRTNKVFAFGVDYKF